MPRARARQGGLALVSDLSPKSFGPFLLEVAKKPKGVEGINDLTRQQLTGVSAALDREVRAALCLAGLLDEANASEQTEPPCPDEEIFMSLHGAAILGLELLTKSKQPPPEELLSAATLLHDCVLMSAMDADLGTLQVDVQDAVMRLCVAWWERQLPGKDMLIARTIPYTLLRAVNDIQGSRGTMVHACYVIRDALELLDYDDETIIDTKRLLLVAAMHPAFLREPEGRRFVAGLFKLQPQMTRELVAIMRNQIASGMRSVLEPYGEILFRAWRDTIGPCAADVEEELQSLMQSAILASTPQLAKALRTVLNGLHSHKSLEKRVNPLLVRLYDPILPRSFTVANAHVRRNAVNLLVAAFPILDPDAPTAENQTRLTQQLNFLIDGLADPHPEVREAAAAGCCHCLKYYWEIIPAATSAKILSDITTKLVFDRASKSVRIASLHGLCALTDSQHAQPVLKKALPGVAACILDKDTVVREAMADLLVAVASCRALQSAGVVPLEGLLATLARDKNEAIARKISRIVVPNYLPSAEEGTARVSALLRSNPQAGVALCRNIVARFMSDSGSNTGDSRRAPSYTAPVPTEHILQLVSELASLLLATAPQKRAGAAVTAAGVPGSVTPPPKRPKARRGGKGADANRAAGKKRAKKVQAEQGGEDNEGEEVPAADADHQEGGADNAAAAGPQGSEQQEVGAQDDEDVEKRSAESVAAWTAVLEGLMVLVQGLSSAVENTEECSIDDLAGVLPDDTLTRLLTIAEESVGGCRAPSLVLQMGAAAYMTPGAQKLRDLLFERLADGSLPGLSNGRSEPVMELDGHRGPTPSDVGLLTQVLKTMSTGFNVPKLLAILSASLGVREAQPVRKPVEKKKVVGKRGHGHVGAVSQQNAESLCLSGLNMNEDHCEEGAEDPKEAICHGCRLPQPADTMLLCDGCENACHIDCLRPSLQEVPETDWFCWHCEAQLQAVRLPPAAAARCLSLLLSFEAAREPLLEHPDFDGMIQTMQQLAAEEADAIAVIAQGPAADEADADSAPSGSDARSGEQSNAEGISDKLLGDPWGSLGRFCRAALHRAMWAIRPREASEGAPEDAADAPARSMTPGQTSGAAGQRQRRRRSTATPARGPEDGDGEKAAQGEADLARGFSDLVTGIDLAVQTSISLAELVMGEPNLAAQVAALQYSQGLLRVLLIAHYVDLLALGPDYVGLVAYLCTVLAALARTAASGLADQQDGGSKHQKAVISAVLRDILGLTNQMVAAVRVGTIAGSGLGLGSVREGAVDAGATAGVAGLESARHLSHIKARAATRGIDGLRDDEDLPSQQLEGRMDAAAGAGPAGLRKRARSPSGQGDNGEEGQELPPAVAVERLAVSLMTLMCDPVVGGLLRGEVRVSAADLLGELLSATHRAEADGWLDALCRLTGEALVVDPAIPDELRSILRSQATAGDAAGKEPDSEPAAAGEDGLADPEVGGVRGVVRKPRGGGRGGGKMDAVVSKAMEATAEALSELLKRANPAVGTMSNVLVRVCAARKVFGRAMLLLAGLAARVVSQACGPAAGMAADTEAPDDQQPKVQADGHGSDDDAATSALGAVVLLAICRSEAAAAGATMAQPAGMRRSGGRCGALAQEAAAKAASAEAEAATKALGVLRHALGEDRVLQPSQEQGEQRAEAWGLEAGDGENQQGPEQARSLARGVAWMLARGVTASAL